MSLKIDSEFKNLIPPLTAEEYQGLEQSIIAEGCRDALVTWQGTLIDGHNRYEICTRLRIRFDTKEHQFNDRDEVKEWIIRNQFGRRNISVNQRSLLALKLDDIVKAKALENKSVAGGDKKSLLAPVPKAIIPIHTDKELAKTAGVSPKTIQYARIIQKEGTEEQKERFKKDEAKAKTLYKEIRKPKEANPAMPKSGKLETKEEGGTKVCEICGIEKPIERFAKRYCKDCQKIITYARRDGDTRDIQEFKVDGNALIADMRDTKKPSEEGDQGNISNIIVTEFTSLVNTFCTSINKYAFMNGNISGLPPQDKVAMLQSIQKTEEWLKKIKILLEG
jgi:hypothetical protein